LRTLEVNGKPAFVVLTWDEYQELRAFALSEDEKTIPTDVVNTMVKNDWSLVKCWRVRKGLTEMDMAKKLRVKIDTYSRIERFYGSCLHRTKVRVAKALNVTLEQLDIQRLPKN